VRWFIEILKKGGAKGKYDYWRSIARKYVRKHLNLQKKIRKVLLAIFLFP